MAKPPAGKKSAPPSKKSTSKPAAPKKAAGSAAPARKPVPAKKSPAARAKPVKPTKAAAPAKAIPPTEVESAPIADATSTVLTDKQQRFVDEYMVDMNATQAAIRAGYSAHTANEQGSQLLAKLSIQRALNAARQAQQERTKISADGALREAWNIATADTRELVELKTGCCRCCYGEGHKWQRTVGEMNRDREQWVEKGNAPAEFDEKGGIGFNPLRAPHPECPECGGDGLARVVLKDTRNLSEKGVALYAGAKQTQFGIEVKMQDKSAALEKVFKHLGLYEKDNQQKTDPLASLLARVASGNGNGFAPVQNDPERQSSAMPVRQDVPEDDEG